MIPSTVFNLIRFTSDHLLLTMLLTNDNVRSVKKITMTHLGASYTILDYYRSDINLRCFPVLYALRTFHICCFCLILLYIVIILSAKSTSK